MPGKVRLSILSLLALAFFVHGVAGGQTLQLFIPCSAAANTTLEGLLVGMEITSLQGDNCSWQFSYQFLQPQTDMNSLTKLSSLTLDMGINLVEDSCWTGCISNVSVSSSWNFNENSCSCMNKSYVFNIARTGVTPVMGQITLVDGLGERVVCSALVFSPCSSNNTINMTDLCPLHNPLGIVAPASDDCSAIGIPSSMHASAAKHPDLSAGAIAGIVIGALAGAAIVGALAGTTIGGIGYLVWRSTSHPSTTMLGATEALPFEINQAVNNPVYVSSSDMTYNPTYEAPI